MSEQRTAEGELAKAPVWLTYPLVGGFIHDWLVAGPLATPVPDLDRFSGPAFREKIAAHFHRTSSGVARTPVEFDRFAGPTGANGSHAEMVWRVDRCQDDHFVNLSGFYATCHHLQAWAFCAVDSPTAQQITGRLTTNGPADLWVNDAHVHRVEHFHDQIPGHTAVPLLLQEGRNTLLVRFEAVAARACPFLMALQLVQDRPAESLSVALPTSIEPHNRRQHLEALFQNAYLDRDVFTRDESIVVHWPEDSPLQSDIALRLERKDGRIYSEQHTEGRTLARATLGKTYQFPSDNYQILLLPPPPDYYVNGMRVDRRLDIHIVGNKTYSTERYGTYQKRRAEALINAAQFGSNIFSEIAKMELGKWDQVNLQMVHDTVEGINTRADCSDFYLVGLLGMVGRYVEEPGFPQSVLETLKSCFLNFRYWIDEPGDDAMCFWTENHQILFHTCEILAGQLLPDETFTNANMTGREHQAKGEQMALSWLRKRAAGGFREWDSNTYFEKDVQALSHLADLAENDTVRELATVVLDKMLFTIAVNSYKGVFGSTHGRAYGHSLKSAYREGTSGITRLLWGQGIFNGSFQATVSLACAVGYLLPPVIEAIALDPADAILSRERHAGALEFACDREEGDWRVDKVTYKTPDYMLASAQDYRPGELGRQQHVWQATLTPEALVFVTHPPCASEEGVHRPGFWHGNVILPRVAQWQDLLIAVHRLPEDDWMGFTHAYFPLYAFDEYSLRDGWAFARAGDGYLALTAAQGMELVRRGPAAWRELRSYGLENVWLLQMGRAALDGGFTEFQEKVLDLDVAFDAATVRAESLRGDSAEFGWTGPLRINGAEQAITGFPHYDNPYSHTTFNAEKMAIQFQDLLVNLDFSLDAQPLA